jgi:magnesium transporter
VAATCLLYRNGEVAERDIDPARVSDFLEETDALVWLDLADPTEAELSMLREEFDLHPLAIEDTLHRDQRPKLEEYEDHFFLVVHALRWDAGELLDSEIHAFVGRGFLVTIRYAPLFDLAPVRRRWEKQAELTREGGAALLYALLDEVVDDAFEVIEALEDRSETLEEQVFDESPPEDIQEQIFQLKKTVLRFRRRIAPLRDVLDMLEEEPELVPERLKPYYRDVSDHVIRVMEFSENIRELLTSALDAYMSQASHRMNQVMKQVTSWAAIILVPTLIAGIYGMNFIDPAPEFGTSWGFWFAIGTMALSGGWLWWVFRKRDWL